MKIHNNMFTCDLIYSNLIWSLHALLHLSRSFTAMWPAQINRCSSLSCLCCILYYTLHYVLVSDRLSDNVQRFDSLKSKRNSAIDEFCVSCLEAAIFASGEASLHILSRRNMCRKNAARQHNVSCKPSLYLLSIALFHTQDFDSAQASWEHTCVFETKFVSV